MTQHKGDNMRIPEIISKIDEAIKQYNEAYIDAHQLANRLKKLADKINK